jgi:hypothetical protein
MAFLEAIQQRRCRQCKKHFKIIPGVDLCPDCAVKGLRVWDRLTIIAGRRFGKSKIGSIGGALESNIPNSIGWACAPTNPKLHRYVIPAFQELIPNEWVKDFNSEHLDLRLKNGSLIHFQTLEDPDQGRGQGLDWLWIDEVCELSKRHWEVIRPSLAGDTVAFFTTSPRSYDWVYEELYVPALNGTPGYWGAVARTKDSANPKITKEFLARERTQMSDTMYRQEYEADFVVFTGAVYGNLIHPQILRDDDAVRKLIPEWPKIDSWRQILVGIDTGADHPFGAVKLVATELGLVVVGEYLERDKPFQQHCYNMKVMAASPTTKWAINKNERQQILELAQHGIYCQRSENEIIAGTERVKSWLQTKQLWFVQSRCPRTLDQMQAYRWAETTAKDGQLRKEKVFKLQDELPDCIRYALMMWPQLPKMKTPDQMALRDLSHLPGEMRATIERMRRHEGREPEQQVSVVGDFYL